MASRDVLKGMSPEIASFLAKSRAQLSSQGFLGARRSDSLDSVIEATRCYKLISRHSRIEKESYVAEFLAQGQMAAPSSFCDML